MTREPDALTAAAIAGDRAALGRLLTLVEGGGDGSTGVLANLFPRSGRAFVLGITGAPGAGKSTLVDRLIEPTRVEGEVAVVAVDPSSPFSGGAILGDRVRMQEHTGDPGVFIRSMASRGHLGGIALATPKVITVLDAVGFPAIIVETVGVGQAEVEIAAATDTTVVVVNPRWGDGIQAAKAGLLEIGDIFVVNKADHSGADETVDDLRQMLHLGTGGAWTPPIIKTTGVTGSGVGELWDAVTAHRTHLGATGELAVRRTRRLEREFEDAVTAEARRRLGAFDGDDRYDGLVAQVRERRLDPWSAAARLLGA